MKTVGLISLGCPKNLVDSEVMLGLLEAAGYRLVQDPGEADILIVNTCAFIEDAKREAVDTILEMAGYKNGRCKKLVVAGCLTQRYKDEVARLMPEVDLFVGTGEYQNIVELIGGEGVAGFSLHQPARTKVRYSDQPTFIHTSATPRKIATPRHAVYVKIAEGCFHGCSFCIIPKIRGKFRSRTIEDIAKEAEALVKNGARELNLIAQDTTSYGVDLKDGTDLSKLLKRLERINGDFWIRVMYAYPTSITDDLIATVASSRKICSYLDIPIQHISDKILKAMHRKETGEEVRVLIRKIRKKMPEVTLRTSLIVGFPGETAKEFDELVEFVKEGLFDHVGVFTYSREEGTKASELSGQVPQGTALRRRARLMKAQALVSKRLNRKWVGQRIRALIDVADAEHDEATARTQGQAPDIDGVTLVKGRACAGEFADVKIIGVKGYDLVGAKG